MAYLKNTGLDDNLINEFLDIMTWEAGSDEYLDLQYKPLLYIDGYFSIHPSLTAKSNVVRNIFPSESKKGNLLMKRKNENYDKLIYRIKSLLEHVGFNVEIDVDIKYTKGKKKGSDIDILAWKEDLLLIVEAKDTIVTTDSFEFRTLRKHLYKAYDQLTYHLEAIKDENVQKSLKSKFNLDIVDFRVVQPLILTSNRKPWGSGLNSVPIRNIFEIEAFLTRGIWEFKLGDEEKLEINNWTSKTLSKEDIMTYLDDKKKPHNIFYECLLIQRKEYDQTIFIDSFVVDKEMLISKLRAAANK